MVLLSASPGRVGLFGELGVDGRLHQRRGDQARSPCGGIRSGISGGERGVADLAAGQREPLGQGGQVDPAVQPPVRQMQSPQLQPLGGPGPGHGNGKVEAAQERLVDGLRQIRRQHGDALERFQPLQQVVDLDVGVAVMRVLNRGALAEQRIRFVKEQQRRKAFRGALAFARPLPGPRSSGKSALPRC